MLLLHRQRHAARTPQEQHVLDAQIEAKDRQIDRLEYALCGLTVEEIRIVEGRKMGWALAVEEGKWSMVNGQRSIVNEGEPDPFTFDSPEAIRAALWRFEQRKMLADDQSLVVCDA